MERPTLSGQLTFSMVRKTPFIGRANRHMALEWSGRLNKAVIKSFLDPSRLSTLIHYHSKLSEPQALANPLDIPIQPCFCQPHSGSGV